jgi:hypothetical protein
LILRYEKKIGLTRMDLFLTLSILLEKIKTLIKEKQKREKTLFQIFSPHST